MGNSNIPIGQKYKSIICAFVSCWYSYIAICVYVYTWHLLAHLLYIVMDHCLKTGYFSFIWWVAGVAESIVLFLYFKYITSAFIFVSQNFYMIGRDKTRTYWRVLKIDRLDPSELNLREDSTTYTESECSDLLRRIHEGNKSTGGLKFVTTCYGIVGM